MLSPHGSCFMIANLTNKWAKGTFFFFLLYYDGSLHLFVFYNDISRKENS